MYIATSYIVYSIKLFCVLNCFASGYRQIFFLLIELFVFPVHMVVPDDDLYKKKKRKRLIKKEAKTKKRRTLSELSPSCSCCCSK